jgi:hypothetical protein
MEVAPFSSLEHNNGPRNGGAARPRQSRSNGRRTSWPARASAGRGESARPVNRPSRFRQKANGNNPTIYPWRQIPQWSEGNGSTPARRLLAAERRAGTSPGPPSSRQATAPDRKNGVVMTSTPTPAPGREPKPFPVREPDEPLPGPGVPPEPEPDPLPGDPQPPPPPRPGEPVPRRDG